MVSGTFGNGRALPRALLVAAVLFLMPAARPAWCDDDAQADSRNVPVTVIDSPEGMTAIRAWLVAGTFPSRSISPRPPLGAPWREGFDRDYLQPIGGEAAARPQEGTQVRLPSGHTVRFMSRRWNTDYIDLTELYGRSGGLCAYIYSELESPREQHLYLHVGSNDAAKVWLNGREVVADPIDHGASRSQHVVPITLREGRNRLLMKIDQAGANWGAYVEISPDAVRRRVTSNVALQEALLRARLAGNVPRVSTSGIGDFVSAATVFGWVFLGIILFFIWAIVVTILIYRRRRALESEMYNLRMAAIQNGMDPRMVSPTQVTGPPRTTAMVIYGLLLALGGLGLTIAEVAGSGLRNAGLELAIMLVGIGLVVGAEYARRTADSRRGRGHSGPGAPDDDEFAEAGTRLNNH